MGKDGIMPDYEKRLKELGLEIPAVPEPVGAYVPAVKTGNLVFCSGQGPKQSGRPALTGRVGGELTPEQGYQAARVAALNCLAEIISVLGSINRTDASFRSGDS